ncbi:MAG: DNA-binding transcriptional LysR family regulator [Candidatus Azotimanducaceae bacterium]|jgi:DNA-binding transcriptional LysR family regulator
MTNDNIYTIKKAAEANIGILIVPVNWVSEKVYQGTLARLKVRDARLLRPLALLKLKETKLNLPLEYFVERLLEFSADTHVK